MAIKQMESTMVKVNGIKFYLLPFPAFKAANISGELASVLSPLLGILAPLVDDGVNEERATEANSKSLMDIDAGKAAEAMANCTAINGDKLEKLMKKLLLGGHITAEIINENGETEGERLNEDLANEIFCGDVQDMFVLCFHVIKLNFNGFFKKFAALSGKEESAKDETPRKRL